MKYALHLISIRLSKSIIKHTKPNYKQIKIISHLSLRIKKFTDLEDVSFHPTKGKFAVKRLKI